MDDYGTDALTTKLNKLTASIECGRFVRSGFWRLASPRDLCWFDLWPQKADIRIGKFNPFS